MKKLGKLIINPEKLMKNEELINLRGGGSGTCAIYCAMPDGGPKCNIDYDTAQSYVRSCKSAGGDASWCCDSCSTAPWYDSACNGNWPYS